MEIALLGQPNTGKTSLFNILTGSHQIVGNWPGVTVDRKLGYYKKDKSITIVDLPGIYSLAPYSPEEVVARDYLLKQKPDVILNIVDGSNLERHLYFTLQLIDLGLPMVIAVNIADVMKKKGIILDTEKLSYLLGVPVVLINASRKEGMDELDKQLRKEMKHHNVPKEIRYDERLEAGISEAETVIKTVAPNLEMTRFHAIKLLENDQLETEIFDLTEEQQESITEIRETLEKIFDDDIISVIVNQRYNYIEKAMKFSRKHSSESSNLSEKIDKILTNKWLAFPLFALIMWFIYYLSIQSIGAIGTDWLNDVFFGEWVPNAANTWLESMKVAPWLQGLIVDGIIAGVGAVIGFLPQLAVLFFCLAFLEDCGYMARIAYVMDRVFRKIGLSGKSFIPILISTGCGVPGIMATRTIENENDRQMTLMMSTFMPCSAKTAIIGLIAGAFFPNQSWVAPSVYFISLAVIIISGLILKKFDYFHRDKSVFLMEMPPFHLPRLENLLRQTWHRASAFLKKAATIIFVCSVFLWFASHFNWKLQMVDEGHSILASIGHAIDFIFAPLGFGDWKAAVAILVGFTAKENVVNTMGILYHQSIASENGHEIWRVLRENYSVIAGYSFLIFNILCTPCIAAIGALRREIASKKMWLITIGFQCLMAYATSFVIYQIGQLFITHHCDVWTILAFVVVGLVIYLMTRRAPKEELNG